MSTLFPFINPPTSEENVDNELPMFSEIAWDFENNVPVIENGDFKILEGNEAIKVWCYFAINTNRYEHTILSWDYGNEVISLVGQPYTQGLTRSEVDRFIKEALLINPYILEVSVSDVSFVDMLLSANVKIKTIYGESEVML